MSKLPFTYEEFSEWFDDYSKKYLEPAKESASRALREYLDAELPEIERVRVKVSPGRVKGKERTWKKLELNKYRDRVKSLQQIPQVIDDLVGLRVTCNNKSDVQRVMDLVRTLRVFQVGQEPVLEQQEGSFRDYLDQPKPSGYRAIHINLCTSVSTGLKRRVVTCELQIRTLLQDGWGELTHEDTYKPGSTPPVLVETLSRRMADLLAAVDDIAQDLRQELDRLSTKDIEVSPEGEPVPASAGGGSGEVAFQPAIRDAASEYLRNRVAQLQRPMDLASLAWELSRKFGQEVSQGWFGLGNFKSFLRESIPNIRMTDEPPSYVLPGGYQGAAATKASPPPGIPAAAMALRDIDRSFPLLDSARLNAAYRQLAEASESVNWADETTNDIGRLNEMTRRARELNSEDLAISRTHLDYIAKSLLFSGNLGRPLTTDEIKSIYSTWTVKRLRSVTSPSNRQVAAIRKWLS
ncbi:GTP pyrophosphokinase [Streptomyces winkii]|uniref:GTP pyrophosphokinase n=1 Tax=Streptomyces winkii TaxID=3051178 RepID=UPI0028D501A0|nr:RelA/SpoT domain-containing protein [Streptomyces sp. DSM 40971]